MVEDENRTLREEKVCRKNHLGKLFPLHFLVYLCPRFRGIALLSKHTKKRIKAPVQPPEQSFKGQLKLLEINTK
ncbi:hypothetical protein EVA_12509 [gut metagenome]|uniref:Uncharacterized protein n=1 Tax=gut metagenome TaxID=749906 RepID=J9FWM5_9ZZZZ